MEEHQTLENFIKCNSLAYKKIVHMLDTDRNWEKVISSLQKIKASILNNDLYRIQNSPSPSQCLLFALIERECPVLLLCNILRDSNLLDVLSLVAKPEPLEVIVQPGEENENIYVMPQGELTLECKAVGLPPPMYQWRYFNMDLPNQTEPVLHISEFMEANVGEYYCFISHCIEGKVLWKNTKTVTVDLMPKVPQFINGLPPQVTVQQNKSITLKVKVQARPQPTFQWIHKNTVLLGQTSDTLEIRDIQVEHEGPYRCFAKNSVGTASTYCKVTVYSPPNQASAKMALLIANQEYQHLNKLKTPDNDVLTLAKILQTLDFKVFVLHNLTLVEMRNACVWFFKLVPQDSYALVFFGGHGFEHGQQFMMPVDCPKDMFHFKDCMCIKELLQLGEKASVRLLVLLDMCLRIPSTENKNIHEKSLPVYQYVGKIKYLLATATSSNLSAYEEPESDNSLYVKHLSKYLTADIKIWEIFNKITEDFEEYKFQVPGYYINFPATWKLSDPCENNKRLNQRIKAVTDLSTSLELNFNKVNIKSVLLLRHHKGYFLNSIDLVFPPELSTSELSITAEINSKDLNSYFWWYEEDRLVLTIHNIQKVKISPELGGTRLCATINLNTKISDPRNFMCLIDSDEIELDCPILKESLWYEKATQ